MKPSFWKATYDSGENSQVLFSFSISSPFSRWKLESTLLSKKMRILSNGFERETEAIQFPADRK